METGEERGERRNTSPFSPIVDEIAGDVIELDDPKENTTRPHIVELNGMWCVCWSMRISEGFHSLCRFLHDLFDYSCWTM